MRPKIHLSIFSLALPWSARTAMLVRRLLGAARAPLRNHSSRAARWASSVLTGSVKELRSCVNKKILATRAAQSDGDASAAPVEATVKGWVRSARHQKAVSFLEVVDGSCVHGLQVVLDADRLFGAAAAGSSSSSSDSTAAAAAAAAAVDTKKALTTGCSVEVSGRLLPHPKQAGLFELHGDRVRVLGECSPEEYPLQKKYAPIPSASAFGRNLLNSLCYLLLVWDGRPAAFNRKKLLPADTATNTKNDDNENNNNNNNNSNNNKHAMITRTHAQVPHAGLPAAAGHDPPAGAHQHHRGRGARAAPRLPGGPCVP
jgi:hypothetical protein